jgi:N-acetyl sugar amidotransferase
MNRQYFLYENLICLTNNKFDLGLIQEFIENNIQQNTLLCLLDHRLYSLKSKNIIKNKIDILDLDYLMFSIKPSIITFIKKKFTIEEVRFFKKFINFYFLLLITKKYSVANAIIFSDYEINFKIIFDWINKKILKNSQIKKKQKIFFSILKYSDYLCIKNNIKIVFIKKKEKFKSLQKKQIKRKEKNFFWVGFDNNIKDINWKKNYKKDYWYKFKNKNSKYGEPLFKNLQYCSRCCLPETSEGMDFDKFGICKFCRNSEQKMVIDWNKRGKMLKSIFKKYKSNNYYEALLPISGGKDSMYQAHVLKMNGVHSLAVTHGQNWLSLTGRYNLSNLLEKFDLDHLIFVASRSKINRVARKSLYKIGDSCWHCHIGAGTFSVQTALFWKLNLLIYGEGPGDTDARGSHERIVDPDVFMFLKGSALKKAEEFEETKDNKNYLSSWKYPNLKEIKELKMISLGNYIFWDEHKNINFVINHYNWMNSKVENTYKGYKSNECIMAGVHDYLNFLKRGIGRATIHASEDVRRGLITRSEGFELAKDNDIKKPHALNYYKKITGLKEDDINKIIKMASKSSKFSKRFFDIK